MNVKRTMLIGTVIAFATSPLHSATLTVHVTDEFSGEPVDAAVVATGTSATLISTRTDKAGTAVLNLPSLDGVSIAIRGISHGVKCIGPELTKSGEVRVSLPPGVRINGVARSAVGGGPVEGASVRVLYGADNCRVKFDIGAEERTNPEGEFALRNVDPGREFKIVVLHNSYQQSEVSKADVLGGLAYPSARQKDLSLVLFPR